jgi:hypothetical protein
MIHRPTVFVLGAGASMAYGFPSGSELGTEIAEALDSQTSVLYKRLFDNGIDREQLNAFPRLFRESSRDSVDGFLQSRTEFRDMGKMAMVLTVGVREIEKNLFPKEDDWLKYLLGRMTGGIPHEFASNQLRIITFNFDRSFERRLFLAVQANYNLGAKDARDLCKCVPILHMHGDLGPPSWEDDQAPLARPYEPFPDMAAGRLAEYVKRIRIVHDEIEESTIKQAQTWLQEAEQVCFLGFGYLQQNLDRLKARALGATGKPLVAGTFFGLMSGEVSSIRSEFANRIQEFDCDALTFLRKSSFIHQ